jgi:hypothetical protein
VGLTVCRGFYLGTTRRLLDLYDAMTFREQKKAHRAFRYTLYGLATLTAVVFMCALLITYPSRHTAEDFALAKVGQTRTESLQP